jgi:hypothetical protein
MKTAIRTLALAGIVGFALLAGNVSTAKAQNVVYPGYGAYPNAYGYSGYYPGYSTGYYPAYSTGYYPYAYATPNVYVGGYWGPGYWGGGYRHGYWGRGNRGYYWGRGHWRR